MTPYGRLFELGCDEETIYFANIGGSCVVLGRNARLVGQSLGIVVRKETFEGEHGTLHTLACRIPEHHMDLYKPKLMKATGMEVVCIKSLHVLEKYNKIMNLFRAVVSDDDLDAMVGLPRSNSIKSVPNPNRVGILDAYVAYL